MGQKAKNMIGYLRVSSAKQKQAGWGMAAQQTALDDYEAKSGDKIIDTEKDEAKSGKSMDDRDGLLRAMERCKSGEADGIVIAKLDRLIRNIEDYYALRRQAREDGYELVALDFHNADRSNPYAVAMAEMVEGFGALQAQYERHIISIRTKDAMAELKANGVHCGRPRTYDDMAVREHARRLRAEGYTVSEATAVLASTYNITPSRTTVARMMRDDSIPLPDIAMEALRKVTA
jgi:DNA invertase Pin-like site-specific DNA recombinase